MPRLFLIDGGTATGKDTLGSKLAKYLNFKYIDSGKYYRLLTYLVNSRKLDYNDESNNLELLKSLNVEFTNDKDYRSTILLDGVDMTSELTDINVVPAIQYIAQQKSIRAFINSRFIKEASENNLVMTGRALAQQTFNEYKIDKSFFIICDPHIAAKRRYLDLVKLDSDLDFNTIESKIVSRNKSDSNHLKILDDMIVIDNSGTLEDSFSKIIANL